MDDRCYLIVKRDLYYRPDAAGYTGIKDHAGRYTLSEAQSRANDEVSFVHEDEAPDYTKACFHDLKAEHLEGKLKSAEARIEELELKAEALRCSLAAREALLADALGRHDRLAGLLKEAEEGRDKAWNEAIEAAVRIVENHGADCRQVISALGDTPAIKASAAASHGACKVAAGHIRSLARLAAEREAQP